MLTSLSEQSRHDFYSSTSSRATFTDLPPETLEQITRCLCNSRKQHFDTIAIQDLQNLRLTSRALCLVATPVLFENLVFDEKFLEPQQLSRIIDFAAQNPDLAKWVRRLQHKVAPILLQDAPGILGTTAAAEICAESGTTPQLMESKERYCKESDINTLLLDPIRRWVWNALARKHRQLPGIIGLGQLPTSENEEATYEVSSLIFVISLCEMKPQVIELLQHIMYSVYCADKLTVGNSVYNRNTTQPSSILSALSQISLTSKSYIQTISKITLMM